MKWEKLKIEFEVSFAEKEVVLKKIREQLLSLPGFGWEGPMEAAIYCLENSFNYDEALKWINLSVNRNPNFQNRMVKVELLEKMGNINESERLKEETFKNSTEAELNLYGYKLLNDNKIDDALKIFKQNLDRFSNSWVCYDSYAETLLKKGKTIEAKNSYKKAFNLAPDNQKERIKNIIEKKSGKVITKNVGGTQKTMVYAPINYDKGVYKKYGVFGGITIGIETRKFLSTSYEIKNIISKTFEQYFDNIAYVIFGSIIFSFIISFFFSRNFTKPIVTLTKFSRNLADGKLDERIDFIRNDEIGSLAHSFNRMANELEKGRNQLLNSNAELADSRTHIENYAFDLEYQLNVLKSIQTISNTIGLTYDLDTILKKILETSIEHMHFDRAILYLMDDISENLVFRDAKGFTEKEIIQAKKLKITAEDIFSIEGEVIKTGEILFVENYKEYAKSKIKKVITPGFSESNAFLFIPLFIQEKIIGVIGSDKVKNKISENDISSFQILANQASRVIENSQLYSEIISQRNFVNDIISNMMNGVISTNGAGKITSINKAARNTLELPEGNLIGENIWELLSQEKEFKDEILNSLSSIKIYKAYEKELILNNKKKYLNINASRLYQEGSHTSSILIVEDVSEKKLLDEELKKIDRLASLGRFAAGIAHEIRNPLTGLSLFLDNLHDHISLADPTNSSLVSHALNEVERLDKLVSEILDYSVPTKSRMQNANINAIMNSILLLLGQQLKKTGINVNTKFEKSLPDFAFDAERIKQALLNIIINSIQFMPSGGTLFLETKLLENKNSIYICITDTGKGFVQNETENIFDPFYSGRQEGTGLGLAITHSIISEHNGTIIAANSKKHGAEFKIIIPLDRKI